MDQQLMKPDNLGDPFAHQVARAIRVVTSVGAVPLLLNWRLPAFAAGALRLGFRTRAIYPLHAILQPGRPALTDDRRPLSYGEAQEEMARLGNALAEQFRVVRRTPVILMVGNTVEYVVGWFALAGRGALAVHASPRMTPRELEYLVQHSGARVVLVNEESHATAAAVGRGPPELGLQIVVVTDRPSAFPGALTYAEVVGRGSKKWKPARKELGQAENVVYTSGTTGSPKGAVRDFSLYSLRELFRLLERLPFRVGDQHLVVSPLYHSAGQIFVILQATLGAHIHLRPHFDPEDALRSLSQKRINSSFMVPTMIRRLVSLPDEMFQQHPTPCLRGLVSGAGEFPQVLREAAIKRFGAANILDFYGATELGWITLINGKEMLGKPGSVGRPLAGQQIRVVDEQGKDLPRGHVGKIYVRNAQTMSGYLNDEASTRASMLDGWMTVDDLGYVDEQGYVFLVGRARDMVKSGGVNIYPAEIEDVLRRHPAIKDVAVIGVPDAEWGERLVGVVVPAGREFDPADVEAFARTQLASLKVPRRWEVLDELPCNSTGKVLKVQLRQRFAQAPSPGSDALDRKQPPGGP